MYRVISSADRRRRAAILKTCLLAVACVFVTASAIAQEPAPTPSPSPTPEPAEEERSTGLPKKGKWTFNFDFGVGGFGFANSLYTNVRPDPSGNLGDNWLESYVKPAISADFGIKKSVLYIKASAVGERTFAAPPSLVGEDASSFGVEDLYVGWRSGTSMGIGENALEFTAGRARYRIGHGFLIWDGAGEGGSRGAFWSNARQAWQFAGIARFKPKNHTLEAFYLDRNDVPENDAANKVLGGNYELAVGEKSVFGATYLHTYSDQEARPLRNGMNVFDVRAFTAPFRGLPGLSFALEYAREKNGDLLESNAWTAKAAYEFSKVAWKPTLSYRYAYFQGDDPATPTSEAFDPLFLGFYDWGTWWQGEIAGEYFVANSNLISDEVRLSLTPSESVGAGLIAYLFRFDQLPAGATSKDIAFELDGYCDWKLNKNFTVSVVAAFADPQEAVQQLYDRTQNFVYGMIYVTYSY